MQFDPPFINPYPIYTEIPRHLLEDVQEAVETRNIKKIQSSLSSVSIALACPKTHSERASTDTGVVCKLIEDTLEYAQKIEIYNTDDPRFELAFLKVILHTQTIVKRLGLNNEMTSERNDGIDEMDRGLYLNRDELLLDTETQERLIERKKGIAKNRAEAYDEIVYPDIIESWKKPGCRKFDKNYLKIRDNFVKACDDWFNNMGKEKVTDLKAEIIHMHQMDLLLLEYRDFIPYKKILNAIRENIANHSAKLTIGISELENNHHTRNEKVELLTELLFCAHKFNSDISELNSFLDDKFLEPDSEKCAEYYYESFLLSREDNDEDFQKEMIWMDIVFEDFDE